MATTSVESLTKIGSATDWDSTTLGNEIEKVLLDQVQ
jgi:hypothetical protein